MKRFLSALMALLMLSGMVLPSSLAEEIVELELVEEELTPAELPEAQPEAAASIIAAVRVAGSGHLLSAECRGFAPDSIVWQSQPGDASSELSEELWQTVSEEAVTTVPAPEAAVAYRAVAVTADGLYVSQPCYIAAAEAVEEPPVLVDEPLAEPEAVARSVSVQQLLGDTYIDINAYRKSAATAGYSPAYRLLGWNSDLGAPSWTSSDESILSLEPDPKDDTVCYAVPHTAGTVMLQAGDQSRVVTVFEVNDFRFGASRLSLECGSSQRVYWYLGQVSDWVIPAFKATHLETLNYSVKVIAESGADDIVSAELSADKEYVALTGLNPGNADVSLTIHVPGTNKTLYSAVVRVNVNDPENPYDHKFRLSGPNVLNLKLYNAASAADRPRVYQANVIWAGVGDIEWYSSDPSVLRVEPLLDASPDGHCAGLLPLRAGKARITARSVEAPEYCDAYEVEVYTMTGFSANPAAVTLGEGEEAVVRLQSAPNSPAHHSAFIEALSNHYYNVEITTSNRNVAEAELDVGSSKSDDLSDHIDIHGHSSGRANITVTLKSRSTGKKLYSTVIRVTVTDNTALTTAYIDGPNYDTITLEDTLALSGGTMPAGSAKDHTWKASPAGIVELSDKGDLCKVRPLRPGTVTITFTAIDGRIRKTATRRLKVIDGAALTALKLAPASGRLYVGSSLDLAATVEPHTAQADITYKSSNERVATVDPDGTVTGVAPGSATITATAIAGTVKKTATARLTVAAPYDIRKVSLNLAATLTMGAGSEEEVYHTHPTDEEWDAFELESLTAVSSRPAVADFDPESRRIKAGSVGTATITFTLSAYGTGKTVKVTVKVVDPNKLVGAYVSATSLKLVAGYSSYLTAAPVPSTVSRYRMSWTSSRPDVATVDAEGCVSAVAPGSTVLTCTVRQGNITRKATVRVTVTADRSAVKAVSLPVGSIVLTAGGREALIPIECTPANARCDRIDIECEDDSILSTHACVDEYLANSYVRLQGLKPGETDVAVIVYRGSSGYQADLHVTVTEDGTLCGVQLTDDSARSIAVGEALDLSSRLLPVDTACDITWATSDPSVLKLDSASDTSATFSGLSSGTAVVTVTATQGDLVYTDSVAVVVGTPVCRAFLVGNTYRDIPSMTLKGPDVDATSMRGMLGSFTGTPFITKLGLDLTAKEIMYGIISAFRGASDSSVSLFYYSGHGAANGALVGADTDRRVGISPSTLRTALDKIPGTKIVIVDACHSGALIDKELTVDEETDHSSASAFNAAFISAFSGGDARSLADQGYYVLTACSSAQLSWSTTTTGKVVSAFTYALEAGCGWSSVKNAPFAAMPADRNGDSEITLSELAAYVSANVNRTIGAQPGNDNWTDVQSYPTNSPFVLFSK